MEETVPVLPNSFSMRESCQIVRVEKHRVEDITALTFAHEPCDVVAERPLVFVVHGLMSRKERHIELCLLLAEAGFLACTLDARHHGERATPEAVGRLSGTEFAAAFAEAVLGTVADVETLAAYFGNNGYGIIGHSMGGFVALKAGVSDPGARVVVSIAGNPDWANVGEDVFLPPSVRAFVHAQSPLTHADRFWPRPLLLLHGEADLTVPVEGARRLHAALAPRYAANPERLSFIEYPGVGHEFPLDMATRAVAWMQRFLHP